MTQDFINSGSFLTAAFSSLLASSVSVKALLNNGVTIERLLSSGQLDLIYLAPERLLQNRTINLLHELKVSLFAIDEAHCVSRWGHDFSPEYMKLSVLHHEFPHVPRVALTATADERG